jgi:hypothetical protein
VEASERKGPGVGVGRMTEQPDFEGRKEWSKQELFSLQNRFEHRRTIAHIATFLRRTEAEVREKAAELGLKIPD